MACWYGVNTVCTLALDIIRQVAALKPDDELPEDLMRRFYFTPYALLRCGRYVDRIQPFLKHFKPEKRVWSTHA